MECQLVCVAKIYLLPIPGSFKFFERANPLLHRLARKWTGGRSVSSLLPTTGCVYGDGLRFGPALAPICAPFNKDIALKLVCQSLHQLLSAEEGRKRGWDMFYILLAQSENWRRWVMEREIDKMVIPLAVLHENELFEGISLGHYDMRCITVLIIHALLWSVL